MSKVILFVFRYLCSIFACVYLYTFGFWFSKNRALIVEIFEFFFPGKKSTEEPLPPEPIIPKEQISKIVPTNISIHVPGLVAANGNIEFLETMVLIELIKRSDPKNIFEIGTFDGRTTLNMAANSSAETKIFTLDLPQDGSCSLALPVTLSDEYFIKNKIIGEKYLESEYKKNIIQLYGDSATFDFSSFYNKMDLILVDGSHSYEYALSDSQQALKLLKNKQGIILWHDYSDPLLPELTRALNELYLKYPDFKDLKRISDTSFICYGLDQAGLSKKNQRREYS